MLCIQTPTVTACSRLHNMHNILYANSIYNQHRFIAGWKLFLYLFSFFFSLSIYLSIYICIYLCQIILSHTETYTQAHIQLNLFHPSSLYTLVSNPRNCRLSVYVSFLFAPPRISNSSLFVLPLIGAPSSFVLIRPYSCLIGFPSIETSV